MKNKGQKKKSISLTEKPNRSSRRIDNATPFEITRIMNREDERVARAVRTQLKPIAKAIRLGAEAVSRGGRLLYVGAGTSGRLGVLDAAECPPTFSVSPKMVQGIIAGGTGAPLVPYADYLLFRKKGKVRALLNLGGIANVTVLPGRLEEVMAFDTGPANMVIDSLVRLQSRGRMKWDPEGQLAGRGRINEELLGDLMRHPYFQLSPPKSTGREMFGEEFAKDLWGKNRSLPWEDLLATATFFTAASVYQGFDDFIFSRFRVDEIFVSGGGMHNQTLMGFLRKVFGPIPIGPLNDLGVDGDAKEALAFALLADATLQGLPSNVPGATGARRPAVLGKIIL